jgi:hypothetical protein
MFYGDRSYLVAKAMQLCQRILHLTRLCNFVNLI